MKDRTYRPSDPDVRLALYTIYKKKDFYSPKIIYDQDDMVVDHIIAKVHFVNGKINPDIAEKFGLSLDFQMNSLENYALTTGSSNRLKGTRHDYDRVSHALWKAKESTNKLIDYIERFNIETDLREAATAVALKINSEQDEKLIASILFSEEPYTNQDFIFGDIYVKSFSNIYMTAKLPTLDKFYTSCYFSFRTLKLRKAIIYVSQQEILGQLFAVSPFEVDILQRSFIFSKTTMSEYLLTLGSCSFSLSADETKELCIIIDRYREVYFDHLDKLNYKYFLSGMKITSDSRIKLCTIKNTLCSAMLKFVNTRNRGEKWDIFESNNCVLKIFTHDHNDFNDGYHAIMYLKIEENFYSSLRLDCNNGYDVGIYLQLDYTNKFSKVSTRDWWTPVVARNWLMNELFPECLKYAYGNSRKRAQKNIDYTGESNISCKVVECEQIITGDYSSEGYLLSCVSRLQSFYSLSNQRTLYFNDGCKCLYIAFEILIESCTKSICWPYICGNLGTDVESYDGVKDYILQRVSENSERLGYRRIELLLRCFKECINKAKVKLDVDSYYNFIEGLRPLIEEYNYHQKREWYLK